MSLSKWQKLNDRMTEKVKLVACVAARDDTAPTVCVAPEASDLSVIVIG